MGQRGPAPKPAKVTQLHGNPGRRPLPNQPATIGGAFPCPDHLEGIAREFWETSAPLLERMFVLGASDWVVLEQAAVVYRDFREADSAQERRRTSGVLLPLLSKLGMTPADRLRMVVPPKEEPKRSHVLD